VKAGTPISFTTIFTNCDHKTSARF